MYFQEALERDRRLEESRYRAGMGSNTKEARVLNNQAEHEKNLRSQKKRAVYTAAAASPVVAGAIYKVAQDIADLFQ